MYARLGLVESGALSAGWRKAFVVQVMYEQNWLISLSLYLVNTNILAIQIYIRIHAKHTLQIYLHVHIPIVYIQYIDKYMSQFLKQSNSDSSQYSHLLKTCPHRSTLYILLCKSFKI